MHLLPQNYRVFIQRTFSIDWLCWRNKAYCIAIVHKRKNLCKPNSKPSIEESTESSGETIVSNEQSQKGFSVRTNDDLNETLSAMFPDSKIARNFSMARTKAMYAINHGIAPYFKSLLLSSINDTSDIHVYSFDKSLNEITETCKMDLYVRYWDVAYSQ